MEGGGGGVVSSRTLSDIGARNSAVSSGDSAGFADVNGPRDDQICKGTIRGNKA